MVGVTTNILIWVNGIHATATFMVLKNTITIRLLKTVAL